MTSNQQLQVLQEKILEIKSAIFFNLSESVLKFPTTIVSMYKVDDYGYAWFFVTKPKQNINEFETEFPVRLDYFKKGSDCFLQVLGKAWVITDPEAINAFRVTDMEGPSETDAVLVKVKMLKAEYQETASRSGQSWWANAKHYFFTWFRSSQYRTAMYYQASTAS